MGFSLSDIRTMKLNMRASKALENNVFDIDTADDLTKFMIGLASVEENYIRSNRVDYQDILDFLSGKESKISGNEYESLKDEVLFLNGLRKKAIEREMKLAMRNGEVKQRIKPKYLKGESLDLFFDDSVYEKSQRFYVYALFSWHDPDDDIPINLEPNLFEEEIER